MEGKNYIGVGKSQELNEGKKLYNFSIRKEDIIKVETDEKDNLFIHLASRKEVSDKGITHSVYLKPKEDKYNEATLMIRKSELLKAPVNKGNIYLTAFPKNTDNVEPGKPNLVVKLYNPDKEKADVLIGSGFTKSQSAIRDYMGSVRAYDHQSSRSYFLSFKKEELLKAPVNEKGYFLLTISDRKEIGKYGETHVMYLRNQKRDEKAEANISLNKEKIEALKADDKGYITLIAFTLQPEKMKAGHPDIGVKEAKEVNKDNEKNNFVGNGFLNYNNFLKNRDKLLISHLTEAIKKNDGNRVEQILHIEPELLKSQHLDLIKSLVKKKAMVDPKILQVLENNSQKDMNKHRSI